MKNIQISYGPVGGDETGPYYVTLNKPMTVGEFIDEWMKEKPREWGYFGIYTGKDIFGNPLCEYSYGEMKGEPLPQKYLNKKIKDVFGSGGWSRSDFEFKV